MIPKSPNGSESLGLRAGIPAVVTFISPKLGEEPILGSSILYHFGLLMRHAIEDPIRDERDGPPSNDVVYLVVCHPLIYL